MGNIFQPRRLGICLLTVFLLLLFMANPVASAQTSTGEFSLQVTPSPLVFTAKPGVATTVPLKIHNTGSQTEELRIVPRAFRLNQLSGEVSLLDEAPKEAVNWVSFSAPVFTVRAGEWFTENITFSPPSSAGFSYSFALQISRTQEPTANPGERTLKGSVAIFTLINIDRPGAVKKLEIESFGTTKNVYEYLPVTLKTVLKNTGNTIVQPYGNIFIQRNYDDVTPITTLPFNHQQGYILPGTTRSIENTWEDGFPVYTSTTEAGNTKTTLTWDWSEVSKLRAGKYVAKLVAVYNDGARDVPLEATIQFWVLPWKFILLGIIVFAVFAFGLWSMLGKFIKKIKPTQKKHKKQDKQPENNPEKPSL